YAPQDRAIGAFVEWRLARAGGGSAARRAYHDRATLAVLANFGLSTQFAALGVCLAAGRPVVYLWLSLGCGAVSVLLLARRELLARRAAGNTERPRRVAVVERSQPSLSPNEGEAAWRRT